MPTYNTLAQLFTDIAGAIRNKEDTSANIVASDFPSRILALPSGDPTVNAYFTLTRTENKSASFTPMKTVRVYVGYPWAVEGSYGMKWEELEVDGSVTVPVPDINMDNTTWQQEPLPSGTSDSGYTSESLAVKSSVLPVAILRCVAEDVTSSYGITIIKGGQSEDNHASYPTNYYDSSPSVTYNPVFISSAWNSSTTYGMNQAVLCVARRVFTSGSTESIAMYLRQ